MIWFSMMSRVVTTKAFLVQAVSGESRNVKYHSRRGLGMKELCLNIEFYNMQKGAFESVRQRRALKTSS